MEILHLGKYYWPERGGIETATKNLAEIGVDLGHDVSCVVSGSSRGRTVRERVGEVAVTRQSRWLKMLSAPISPELLGLRFHGARVLHLHLPHPMAELAVTKFLARGNSSNTRLIPFLHATPLSQGRLGRLWFSSITARILDRSESILVSNQNLVAAFPELRRWKDRFRVVPFFTDVWTDEHFAKAMTMRNVSRDVLSIGRLVPYKGFDVLVRAWARARIDCAAFRAFRLSIVGSGPEEGDLRRQIEALDLGEWYHARRPGGRDGERASPFAFDAICGAVGDRGGNVRDFDTRSVRSRTSRHYDAAPDRRSPPQPRWSLRCGRSLRGPSIDCPIRSLH